MKSVKNRQNLNLNSLEMFPMFPEQQKLLRKEIVNTLYEYFLYGEIGESSEYIELADALRSANETDEFIIRIDSGGGLLSGANVIINAINQCQAHVHCVIESMVGSAATFVMLACHSYSLGEEAECFVHTASSGYVGKEHEQHAYMQHSRNKIHRMMKDRYLGFLSKTELQAVLNGQDMWFDRDELGERLQAFAEYQRDKYMQEMEALEKEIPDEEKEEPIYTKQLLS